MKTDIVLKIENQEQLDAVQEIVFNAGGKWFCGEAEPQLFESLNLCKCVKICDDKVILRAIDDDCNNSNFVDTNLFIITQGTLVKVEQNLEEFSMNWIPYDGQELEVGKEYLVTINNIVVCGWVYPKCKQEKKVWNDFITAYTELPKPYEKPKSLKERLDEAVNKYCYKFSDEEWKDNDSKQYFIAYNFDRECFEIEVFGNYTTFSPYYFLDILKAQAFMYGFTHDELMKIMKGKVK